MKTEQSLEICRETIHEQALEIGRLQAELEAARQHAKSLIQELWLERAGK